MPFPQAVGSFALRLVVFVFFKEDLEGHMLRKRIYQGDVSVDHCLWRFPGPSLALLFMKNGATGLQQAVRNRVFRVPYWIKTWDFLLAS